MLRQAQSLICLPLICLCLPAHADCRLALVLAVDVSRSIDGDDYVIQTEGLAQALEDDKVRHLIFGPEGEVALSVYYWSGKGYQDLVQPWVVLTDEAALDAVIAQVRQTPRPEAPLATALGDALRYAADLFYDAPDCERLVLDVAGDGRNNESISVARAYEREDFTAITVNALAVGEHEADLLEYFSTELIRGPGAFVEFAPTQGDYPQAIRRKLLRELASPMIGALPVPSPNRG